MRCLALICLSISSIALAQDPPATMPTREQLEAAGKDVIEQIEAVREVMSLPATRVERIEDVIDFWIEQDFLAARTTIRPFVGEKRVISPLPGIVRVRVHDLLPLAEVTEGRNFSFIQEIHGAGSIPHTNTHVHAIAGRIILARDAASETVAYNVQLIQDPPEAQDPAPASETDPVRLLIDYADESKPGADLHLKLSAPTFTELRRKHPREVDEHLRPIFRDFGQDAALFAMDESLAWQVLGESYQPDQNTISRVREILARIDSEDFRERAAATKELEALGGRGVLALRQIDQTKFSVGQTAAVEAFLAPHSQVKTSELRRLCQSREFLLDTLESEDAELRALAWERLKAVSPSKLSFDVRESRKVREAQLRSLREELSNGSSATTKSAVTPAR